MAGMSKNGNADKKEKIKVKMVMSSDCEACTEQCQRGLQYLAIFHKKKEGKGVVCKKV